MNTSDINLLIDRVSMHPTRPAIAALLALPADRAGILFERANKIRHAYAGDGIFLRGIIEFSSFCRNECRYCGLTRGNHALMRYRMTKDEIVAAVDGIYRADIRTVVLQSGEDDTISAGWLADVVSEIKAKYPSMAVTLSVGERPRYDYALLRSAGADRYLLKIETSDPSIYAAHHPGMSLGDRLRCLRDLRELGFRVDGVIVGLKGQTTESLARDVLFFHEYRFEMVGIGPLIPHPATDCGKLPTGDVAHVLKMIAVTRLVMKNVHLPATTALGSAGKDYRIDGLRAGANVLMPNFTPAPYREQYEIYPDKRCVTEAVGACAACMDGMASSIGRHIDHGRGDALSDAVPGQYAYRT